MAVLESARWRALEAAHAVRMDVWLEPHLNRRTQGIPHAIEDFLYTYYSYAPAMLRRWHPGFGTELVDGSDRAEWKGYAVGANGSATVTETERERLTPLLQRTRLLLTATASRPGSYGCFGMHEWAMVYRQDQQTVRHSQLPLRLGPAGTDAVVESANIRCSHFDAFRFFTEPARPLNLLQPQPEDRPNFEQPACLHANMDLYKHAARLLPLVSSDLVADAFELAHEIRVIDMRASPYDVSSLGHEPITVETAAGKAEYAAAQRSTAQRSEPLRQQLISECDRLLSVPASGA